MGRLFAQFQRGRSRPIGNLADVWLFVPPVDFWGPLQRTSLDGDLIPDKSKQVALFHTMALCAFVGYGRHDRRHMKFAS